jgi:hypothetical protein
MNDAGAGCDPSRSATTIRRHRCGREYYELTSAWGFNAGYEHYWTPAWHTSLYGAYYQVKYGSQANAMLCGPEGNSLNGAGVTTGFGSAAVAGPGCNNSWSTWGIGSRTQWDVTKTFYLGVEVLYSHCKALACPRQGLWSAPLEPLHSRSAVRSTRKIAPATGWSAFALTATSCPDRLIEVRRGRC